MNVTKCLCISATLLLVACGSRTRDLPKNVDSEYLELVNQGEQLSAQAEKWNQDCNEHINSKDCVAGQGVLATIWGDYLLRTLKYHSKGEGCAAEMRNKIIAFNGHIALFNIRCAGHDHVGQEQSECSQESAFIEEERVELHDQMIDCRVQNQDKKL